MNLKYVLMDTLERIYYKLRCHIINNVHELGVERANHRLCNAMCDCYSEYPKSILKMLNDKL